MQTIGLLGGTGTLGKGLCVHLADSFEVMVGSRSKDKAVAIVEEILNEKSERGQELKERLIPAENSEMVSKVNTIVATVPFEVAVETVRSLASSFRGNQIFISAAAFLEKKDKEFQAGSGRSISEQIQSLLPETVQVAAAFQTVPAAFLYKNSIIEGDVLVATNKKTTYDACAQLIERIKNLRPLYVGSLEVARDIEGLTSILLNVAIKNHLKNPTFKIIDETHPR